MVFNKKPCLTGIVAACCVYLMELGSIAEISEILLSEARATRNTVLRSLCSWVYGGWKGDSLREFSAAESDQDGNRLVTGSSSRN